MCIEVRDDRRGVVSVFGDGLVVLLESLQRLPGRTGAGDDGLGGGVPLGFRP